MEAFKYLLQQKWFQLISTAILGVAIGALFYPTSKIIERTKKEIIERYELKMTEIKKEHSSKVKQLTELMITREHSHNEFKEESSHKLSSLTTENRELRKSSKRRKFRLVKPDGTIIEKEYEESQSEEISSVVTEVREEFNRKVSSIENKWKKVHVSRIKSLREKFDSEIKKVKSEKKEKIVYMETEKITEINKKSFRPEIGINSNLEAYSHITYTLWGPVFIGGGASMDIGTKEFKEARIGLGIEL